jgi:hypothetical protein
VTKTIPPRLLADDLPIQQLKRIFARHYGSKRVAANLAGVGAPYISRILKGQRPAPQRILEILRQMARAFVLSDHTDLKRKVPNQVGRPPRINLRIS